MNLNDEFWYVFLDASSHLYKTLRISTEYLLCHLILELFLHPNTVNLQSKGFQGTSRFFPIEPKSLRAIL